MTTGRINQVATVADRTSARVRRRSRRPAVARQTVERSPWPGSRRTSSRRHTHNGADHRQSATSRLRADRSLGPLDGRERPFLSPSEHPLRGRNSQDSQVRKESRRVAHRFPLDHSAFDTLAGPDGRRRREQRRRPQSQPGVSNDATRNSQQCAARRRVVPTKPRPASTPLFSRHANRPTAV